MRSGPGSAASVDDAIAQKQGLEAMASVALLAYRILACTHHVAQRLVTGIGHAHRGQFTGASQARQ